MAFDLYISALVEQEISRGDAQAAERRRGAIEGIPLLATTAEAQQLAAALLKRGAVPADSEADALHIAVAATAGVNFLLTWNFKHINNAHSKPLITKVVETYGLVCPILCSPEELGADI